MPRKGPPEGYMSATDAMKLLGKMLYKYVRAGTLTRYGPGEHRRHGYYKTTEVLAILEADKAFFDESHSWQHNPSTTFEQATEEDIPAIVEISRRIFGDPPIPAETRLAWLRTNPETFHVLRNQSGKIVGYTSMLPLKKTVIDWYIRDEIEAEQITDIEPFTPGSQLHLYVMAIGIDPCYKASEKHEYGAALVRGLFAFFFDLAGRGVEIETITARSHKPDGLRLLRKMGFPQLRSPIEGKSLFMVRVAESGFPLFMRYSDLLDEWKHNHTTCPQQTAPQPRQPQKRPLEHSTLPEGLVGWRAFSRLHGIGESTTQKAIEAGHIPVIHNGWVVGKAKVKGALDAHGRAKFYQLYHTNPHFIACPECPHEFS